MPIPAFVVPLAVVAGLGALVFRSKLKDAAHTANDDAQRVAANLRNAAGSALTPQQSQEQIKAGIAAAIAAGGKQVGGVILSTRDQAAISRGLPPEWEAILNGPGEPPTQDTINTLKIGLDAGPGFAPNPATTLKTTKGGSLFDIGSLPLTGTSDTDMVQVRAGDLMVVDMKTAGLGPSGSTAFMALGPADMASNSINAENVDPRVPAGTVMDLPFAVINGIELH